MDFCRDSGQVAFLPIKQSAYAGAVIVNDTVAAFVDVIKIGVVLAYASTASIKA